MEEGKYDNKGSHVTAVFVLEDDRAIGVRDWYDHGDTHKVHSGTDTFHIDKDDIKHIIPKQKIDEIADTEAAQ